MFILNDTSFKILGDLLNEVLNECMIENDIESLTHCIIYSVTFYRVGDDPNNKRVYLQETIENHDIFKQNEVWNESIKFCINKEAYSYKNLNNYVNESQEDKEIRISSVALGQVDAYIENMKMFKVPKEKIIECINHFSNIYHFKEELHTYLISHIENNYEIHDQEIKQEIINDNLSQFNEESLEKIEIYVNYI